MDDIDEPRIPKGKKSLPSPYNQDLSTVLRHLNRRTAWGRRQLANNKITAALLKAGMRLLHRHLGPGARYPVTSERLLLGPLSLGSVADEFAQNDPPFVCHGHGKSLLRDRWQPYSHFVTDLINFAVWEENYRPQYRLLRAANTSELVHGSDFVGAVHDIAYQTAAEGVELPSVRLSLALMPTADGDDEVRRIISGVYADYLGSWKELYAAVIRERGLRLRAGLTLDDLANALSVAMDGTIMRAIGDPGAGVVDDARRRSLMGTVALAVIHAFLEPAEDASRLTLEQAVAARFDRRTP
ncbi:hypothetical protein P8605_33310 [Streptomyces sp. T-3]|nr:hypothetical protein [Streptomyces sp. T-3]